MTALQEHLERLQETPLGTTEWQITMQDTVTELGRQIATLAAESESRKRQEQIAA